MDNLLLYLLKVTAGTTLFYLTYLVFFRKETFYLRNRIFLILTLILPAVFPLLKIPVTVSTNIPSEPVNEIINLIPSGTVSDTTLAAAAVNEPFNFILLITWIYLAVAAVLLLRGLISLFSTYRIIRQGTIKSNQFPKVVISDLQHPPFSFFPYAVIPSTEYNSGNCGDILDHEFAHIRQGHTFDLLLSEIFIAFQWFNPFVWFIKRSVILNHEYLADQVSINTRCAKEYQYRLLNFNTGMETLALAHTFTSLIRNRIIMINKKPTNRYFAWKNILVLPAILATVYAFATPEYHYVTQETEPLLIYESQAIIQKNVKGIVLEEDGKPLGGVYIASTGSLGSVMSAYSGSDGRFVLSNVQDNAFLVLNCCGYASVTVKADYKSDMTIKMSKDNSMRETQYLNESAGGTSQKPLTVLDGEISNQPTTELMSKLGNEFGTVVVLKGKEATDKYGEAGKNGVEEVYSRKKATELGLKFPFRRISPDEYPTFQGENFTTFNDWVIRQLKYPAEATSKGIHGRITVYFSVEADGSVSDVKLQGQSDPLIADAVIKAVQSSPEWEPALKEYARVPFTHMVSLKFDLPDKISQDDVYVMAEKMPMYPGGDIELLKFIAANTKYPEGAKAAKAEGRVIVRFIVNTGGDAEETSILRGVHPLLDEEAVRVVSSLTGFEPGMQGGKPVNVWYMVPVTYRLPDTAEKTIESLKIRSKDGKIPLIVVDGVITDIDVNLIDSETIESVSVLKNQPAIDKYGEKARDGVIEIRTKKQN